MKFKVNLLTALIFIILSKNSQAAVIRDDIDVQVYRDFAENRGVFKPGAVNVPVYKIDGSLSGFINNIPDFSASVDGGFSTLIDPGVTATATHVSYNSTASFGKRFQQLDPTLFSGAEKAESYTLMGDSAKRAYEVDAGTDYKLTRNRTLVTDAAPAELFTDSSQIKTGMLIARVGGGNLDIALPDGSSKHLAYGPLAGGLNILIGDDNLSPVATLKTQLAKRAKTALDVGSLGGDSGSGIWGWDAVSGSWKFIAIDSAISGYSYGQNNYFRSATDWTLATLDSFNDPAINTLQNSDIIHIGAQDAVTGEGDFTLNGSTIRYHGIRTDIAESALVNNDFISNKNLILGGAGGTLQLDAPNVNMGAGSLTFNADYLLSDGGDNSRRLNSAGYIINGAATVLSELTGSVGDIWRKLGTGTLLIGGSGVNHAGLNVGDGLTILQRNGGHAVETLHIGSGRATVRLGAANQLDGTQVGFGTRGGTLDLYGQDLSWSDIIHLDNGATIAATKANALSTFTFTGNGPKTYLGNFTDGGSAAAGLLHLVYAPTAADSSWTLKGNIDTRGGMDINGGEVAVQGALTLHAADVITNQPYIDPTQYESASFDLGDSLVQLTNSQFTVGRNAMARGQFVLDDASTLVLTSGGETSSDAQGILEGAYLEGSVDLQGANSTITVMPEEDFRITINADLTGSGRLIKEGAGTLFLTGVNSLTGDSLVSVGRVVIASMAGLGTQSDAWTIAQQGVLDMADNAGNITTILDKITAESRGVLALNGAIDSTSVLDTLPTELYLGSSTNLALGVAGQNLTSGVEDLYLGGGGGEVSIKGYLPGSGSTLFLGNGDSTGTVRIESRNQNWVGNIDLRQGIRLITDHDDALGDGSLQLGYGSVAGLNVFSNITAMSEGMLNVKSGDTFSNNLSGYQQLAVGALSGESLVLNNTLIPTQTGYYFSGGGEVLINSQLANNANLMVDAQDNIGGSVTLNQVNELDQVTVRGYHDNEYSSAKSDMTLKLGIDNAIAGDARVVLEDGGVIDLNGHAVTLNVQQSSNLSTITSSDNVNASTLNLFSDTNTTLNSQITGSSLHLVKQGVGNLTVTGSNTFSGDASLMSGKTTLGSDSVFGLSTNEVTVARNAQLDLAGHNLFNTLNLSSDALVDSKAGDITLSTLNLSADSSATFYSTANKVSIDRYQLNGYELTLNKMNTALNSNVLDNGGIVFNQSNVNWNGNNNILSGSSGDITLGSGTVLELRDVVQTAGPAKTLVLNGGTIVSGANGNGGGSGAELTSAIRVESSGTLNGNNTTFRLNLKLNGALSGSGKLNITGGQGVSLYGDTSAFNGALLLKNKSKLYLSSLTDTTLAASMSSEGTGKVFKQGTTNLTLTGDNHGYTNDLSIQGGDVVLANAASVTGGTITLSGGRLVLDSAEDMTLSRKISGAVGQIVKQGTGDAKLAGNVDFSAGSDRIAIDLASGSLTNTGSIKARGTAVYVSGENTELKNAGTIEVSGGNAVIEVGADASLNITAASTNGTLQANGSADGILLSAGAKGLHVSGTTIDMSGSTGVGIHNVAGVTDISLTDSTLTINNGVGIHTGAVLAQANSGQINVTGGTGILFSNMDGTATDNDLDLSDSAGLMINVSAAGGKGIVANVSGPGRQVDSAVSININHAAGGSALDVSGAQSLNQTGNLLSLAGDVVRADSATTITNTGRIQAGSRTLNAIVMNGNLDKTFTNSGSITGQLDLGGGRNTVTLTDGSVIDGDITLGQIDNNRVTLSGALNVLTGNVTATGSNTVVNLADKATITGNITLGDGQNTIGLTDDAGLSGVLSVGAGDNTLSLEDNASLGSFIAANGGNNQVLIKDGAHFTSLDAGASGSQDILTFDHADYTFANASALQHFDQLNLQNGADFTTALDIQLGDTTQNIGQIAVDERSSLTLNPLTAYTFNHALSGAGLIDVQSGTRFDFGAAVGDAFTGRVQMNSQDFTLAGTNTEALRHATLAVEADNTTRVDSGTQSIDGLAFNGGTLDFGVSLAGAQLTDAFIDVAGTLDVTGAGTIRINTTINTSAVNTTLGLLDQQGEGLIQLVSAAQVKGGAGNLALADSNGVALSNSDWRQVNQNQVHAANATYDYRMVTDGSGLSIGYGLTQLDLLSHGLDKLVIDTAGSTVNRLSAKLIGSGDLGIQAGTGNDALVLSNLNNSYTGVTDLQAGTLILETDGALGQTSSLNLADATRVDVLGTTQTIGSLHALAGSTLDLADGDLTLLHGGISSGSLTGAGNLRIAGGIFSVADANAGLSATTTVNAGALAQLADVLALGTGTIVSDGEVLFDNVDGQLANNLAGRGQFSARNGSDIRLSGDNSTFAGIISIGSDASLTVSETQHLGEHSGIDNANQLLVDNRGDMTLAAQISGDGQLVKTQQGTLFLSGNNNYTGDTVIHSGTVAISAEENLGDISNETLLDGGALQIIADLTSTRDITLAQSASLWVNSGVTAQFNGWRDGANLANVLTKAGAGTLILNGDNSSNIAGVSIDEGTLRAAGLENIASAAGVINIGEQGVLALDKSLSTAADLNFTRQLTGSGELQANLGDSLYALTFNSSAAGGDFTGTVTMESGNFVLDANADSVMRQATLKLNEQGASQINGEHSMKALVMNGGLLEVGYGQQDNLPMGHLTVDSLDVSGGGTLALTTPAYLDNPMLIVGHSLFDQDNDTGDQIVAASTVNHVGTQLAVTQLDGVTSVAEDIGLIQNGIHAGNAHYDYMALVKADGLYLGHGLTELESFASQSLLLSNAQALDNSLGAKLTGEGGFTIDASGTVHIGNINSDYTGATTLAHGNVALITDNALGNTSMLTMQSDTILSLDGNRQTIGSANFAANSQMVLNQGELTITNGGVIDGTLNGDGNLIVKGGMLTLTAGNPFFTGTTIIESGATTRLTAVEGLGRGSVNNLGELVFDGAEGALFTHLSGDTGRFAFTNGSSVSLAADNSDFAGTLTIEAGNSLTASASQNLGQASVSNLGSLILDTSDVMVLANEINGQGQLIKQGSGTVLVEGDTVSAAMTDIENGQLLIGSTLADGISARLTSHANIHAYGVLGGYGSIDGDVSNAGILRVGSASTGDINSTAYGTFTINGNYSGENGLVAFNTDWSDDSARSDSLVINGDSLGQSNVAVSRVIGDGAQTADGIKLIDVGGVSEGNFTLQGRAVAGAYEYFLSQDNQNGDWYLRSVLNAAIPDGNEPEDEDVHVYRPEAGGYMANMAAASKLFNVRLADREGRAENSSLWLRQVGSRSKFDDQSGQLNTTTDSYVVQGGGEIFAAQFGEDDRLGFGLMAGYGKADSDVDSAISGYDSTAKVDGYSVGVYTTWYQDSQHLNGAYVDSWLQYSWMDASVSGEQLAGSEDYKIKGASASLETGYRQALYQGLNSAVFITPQAQVIWSGIKADDHTEARGTQVQSGGDNNIQTRLGFKLSRDSVSSKPSAGDKPFSLYMETNWIYNSQLASATLDGVNVKQSGGRNLAELKLGAEGQLTPHLNLWSNVQQQIGDSGYSDTSINLGIKYTF